MSNKHIHAFLDHYDKRSNTWYETCQCGIKREIDPNQDYDEARDFENENEEADWIGGED